MGLGLSLLFQRTFCVVERGFLDVQILFLFIVGCQAIDGVSHLRFGVHDPDLGGYFSFDIGRANGRLNVGLNRLLLRLLSRSRAT